MNLNYPLIPDQAFLYFPKKQEIIEVKHGKPHRIIFDGGVKFTHQERGKINQLRSQMNKKQKNDNLREFQQNVLLRFLQATQFNNTNCLKALRDFKTWQDKALPIRLTPQIQSLLKQGILYISGRDYCYRPILVVNVGLILELKPKQKLFLQTLGYFFQFVIQNCLIEGQVQNWVSIIDLGNASVFSLGGPLVDTITFLSNTFRSRVHHSYLVNAPSSIKFIWGIVKGAVNEDQLRKLSISGKKELNEQDFTQINRSQVQLKYGGTKQNVLRFWPLQLCVQNLSTAKSKQFSLITKQLYNQKYLDKQLLHRKINQIYINCNNSDYSASQSVISKKGRQSKISDLSLSSGNNDMTCGQIQQDLTDLNSKIPKQRQPPQIPIIPESFNFQDFISDLVNKFFPTI